MSKHHLPFGYVPGVVLACSLFLPALAPAQETSDVETSQPRADATGCQDLPEVPQLGTSVMVSCQSGDSVKVVMPLKPDAQGFPREKSVQGVYEFREYHITETDQQEQAFPNLLQLLPMTGFNVKYTEEPSTITARNADTWILVHMSGDFYNVSVVRAKEEPWAPVASTEEISRQMDTNHRVAIYGIKFSADNQAVKEESKILGELLKYLKTSPTPYVIIESHKQTNRGTAEEDLAITSKRAAALVAWLKAHGITAGRLEAKGMGRGKAISENDTPLEIQQNDRIELVKGAP